MTIFEINNYNITQLPNGLTVQTYNLPYSTTTSIQVLVKVGSRYENPSNNGISHFLEHMNFKGTAERSAFEINKKIEEIGSSLNAGTSFEETSYSTIVLPQYTNRAIDILCNVVFNSTFPAKELEKEKEVVIQEIKQYEDDVDSVVGENLIAHSFRNQSLGMQILGTEENILSFTRDDLITFRNKFYNPNNVFIAFTGNVNYEKIMNEVSSECSFPSYPLKYPVEPAKFTTDYSLVRKPELSQIHLDLSFEGVAEGADSEPNFLLLEQVLSGGMSTRLFQEFREKNPLVYSISASSESFFDTGLFIISASFSPEKLEKVISTLAKTLQEVTHTISQNELDTAKNKALFSYILGYESKHAIASIINNNLAYHGRQISPEERLEKINAVTIENLHSLATKLFCSNFTVSIAAEEGVEIPSYDQLRDSLLLGNSACNSHLQTDEL